MGRIGAKPEDIRSSLRGPLKAQWTPKSLGLSRRSVMVICTSAIANVAMENWSVHVPVRLRQNVD